MSRETEIKQLQGWKGTVENLIDKFQDALSGGPAANSNSSSSRALSESADPPATAAVDIESGAPIEAEVVAEAANANGDDASAAAEADGSDSSPAAITVTAGEDATKEEAASWDETVEDEWGHLSPHQHMQLAKLRLHFHKDVRRQLYGDAEDKQFFESLKQVCVCVCGCHCAECTVHFSRHSALALVLIQPRTPDDPPSLLLMMPPLQEIKVIEKKVEEARVALQHLEMHLINTACDDPGERSAASLIMWIHRADWTFQAHEQARQARCV